MSDARVVAIDALIDSMLMPRRCRVKGSRMVPSRCMCGHIANVHSDEGVGRCYGGGRRRCDCELFTPYDYAKETAALRRKYRAFALAVLEAVR